MFDPLPLDVAAFDFRRIVGEVAAVERAAFDDELTRPYVCHTCGHEWQSEATPLRCEECGAWDIGLDWDPA